MPTPIPSFPTYFISSTGKVSRTVNGKTSPIKATVTKEGYGEVSLYKKVNGESKRVVTRVQKIMQTVFHLKGKVVDHKNGKRNDNSLKNLSGKSYSANNSNKHGKIYPHARDIYGKKNK